MQPAVFSVELVPSGCCVSLLATPNAPLSFSLEEGGTCVETWSELGKGLLPSS